MGRPVAPAVKPTGWPTEIAGQPVLSPYLMGLAANVIGRAGPGQADTVENPMGPAGPSREGLKNAMGWAGPRPML